MTHSGGQVRGTGSLWITIIYFVSRGIHIGPMRLQDK